jgi:hypothetical protein
LSPLLLPFSWLGSGQRGLGSTVASSRSMATGFGRARTVIFTVALIWLDFVCQVFDELPARISNSKFRKFPPWVINILAKVSSHIFVLEKEQVFARIYI